MRPPKPFVFPTTGSLPHRVPQTGLALGSGAMRGIFQAGVVHAFVLSGYQPGVVTGTSAGCINGAALALAGELPDQEERLAVVSDLIEAWEKNAAEDVFEGLVNGPLGVLARDVVDIDMSVGDLVDAAAAILRAAEDKKDREDHVARRSLKGFVQAAQHATAALIAGAKVASHLPVNLHTMAAGFQALRGFLERHAAGDSLVREAQGILTAYGMDRALLPERFLDAHFGGIFARRGWQSITFGDLKRTHLVFQVSHLTKGDASPLLDLAAPSDSKCADFSAARIVDAMRAGSSFAPFFSPVRVGELFDRVPAGMHAEVPLMDSAVIEKYPLLSAISHWARASVDEGPFRLFVVELDPTGGVPGPGPGFFGPTLHSLRLLSRLDQRYSIDVTEMITELVETLQEAGDEVPSQPDGRRTVAVRTTVIAPREMLAFDSWSVPKNGDLRPTCAAGCRSALEALHEGTIADLCGVGHPDVRREDLLPDVPCRRVLDKVRASQTATPAETRERYFLPLETLCESCPRTLRRPVEPANADPQAQVEANDFEPFHHDPASGAHQREPLTVLVPAGGVFLGIFQLGALAALRAYQLKPRLYAGASIGTFFSYLLDTYASAPDGDEAAKVMASMVDVARTIPTWVDARAPGQPGAIDALHDELIERWRSDAVAPLRDLKPREIVDVLSVPAGSDGALTPAQRLCWERLHAGLVALLFTPFPRHTRTAHDLFARYQLGVDQRGDVRALFENLARLRLDEAVPLLDVIATNLGFLRPGKPTEDGEIIGFASISKKLRDIVFPGDIPVPTLRRHSLDQRVRFIFTTTNHTDGVPEQFGFDDGTFPVRPSPPDAIEACLAAASFPLAFRRRTHPEVFNQELVPDVLYADGGIFNNFPSDAAFAYLHQISAYPKTRWIGDKDHRMLLLSLTSPMPIDVEGLDEDRLLFNLARSSARSDAEKVLLTVEVQRRINELAIAVRDSKAKAGPPSASPTVEPSAIVADLDLISPAYAIYPHAFAFKPYLGFRLEKQEEMIASGCRRARLALEWRAFQSDPGATPESFHAEVRAEVDRMREADEPGEPCLMGRFNPGARAPEQEQRQRCPFAALPETSSVYARCKKTFAKELDAPIKLHRRLLPT